MRFLLSLAIALGLASCGKPTADGHEFDHREWDLKSVQVEVVEYPSQTALRASIPKGQQVGGTDLYAWGEVNPNGRCKIHIVAPEKGYAPEWMGHELAHCLWGRWHLKPGI